GTAPRRRWSPCPRSGRVPRRTGGKATTDGAARFRPDDDSSSAKPVISGRRAKVLRAMMAALIPRGGAFSAGAEDFDLIPRINQLIDKLDPAARLGLPAALLWIELNSLIRTGRPLTALSRERATRLLRGLEHSRLVLNRYILLIFKLLTMMAFYERQPAVAAIGYEHGCHLDAPESGEPV
ncbi:MAG: hypothetical protein R6U29_03890, partial [Desulfosudaceae bacterium]